MVDEANELMDYNIAESIVNLHSVNVEEHFEENKVYTLDQIRKYILWTKITNPQIGLEAEKTLCKEYRKMRERDAGGQASSWRITVRQLESCIRLAEAMARLYAKDTVSQSHVREAARLLNRSIVTVEMPDVEWEDFEENEEELAAAAEQMNLEEDENVDKENVAPQQPVQTDDTPVDKTGGTPPKKRDNYRMKGSEFQKIRLLLLQAVRQREEELDVEDEDAPQIQPYNTTTLSHWFLETMEDVMAAEDQSSDEAQREVFASLKSIDDVVKRKRLLDQIIKKLVDNGELVDLALDGTAPGEEQARILIVNPNVVIERNEIL